MKKTIMLGWMIIHRLHLSSYIVYDALDILERFLVVYLPHYVGNLFLGYIMLVYGEEIAKASELPNVYHGIALGCMCNCCRILCNILF